MTRKKIIQKPTYIQFVIEEADKEAFGAWCLENRVTMTQIILQELEPYIAKGKAFLEAQNETSQ